MMAHHCSKARSSIDAQQVIKLCEVTFPKCCLHMPVALAGLYMNKSLYTEHQHLWVDMVREGTVEK